MKDSVKWWQVFEELSQLLLKIYEERIYDNDANSYLFKKLYENDEFRRENIWIEKFKTKFEIEGLDPIHIFASFNGNKMSHATRVKRVTLLLKILGKPISYENIVFDGCPTPMIVYLIGARGYNDQREIWEVFYDVKKRRGEETLSPNFDLFNLWYGVAFGSFTIFLFWINSDFYLSMDKNNRTFLVASGILERKISDFSKYLDFNKKIRNLNKTFSGGAPIEKYGENGLFREITLLSYQVITESTQDILFSTSFQSLLELSKVDEENLRKETAQKAGLSFKLIALEILEVCDNSLLRNLQKSEIFYFEKDFSIEEDTIHYFPQKNVSIYNGTSDFNINVTAIVGKNGSGKSSLVELFFRIINMLSYRFRKKLRTSQLKPISGLYAKLYYVIEGRLFCLLVRDKEIFIQESSFNENQFKLKAERLFSYQDFNQFFYTVAINYSIYSLNAKHIGTWVNGLFHKNDGYQTPLVINPMRTEGNFDINTENDLANARLLSNIFDLNSDEDLLEPNDSKKIYNTIRQITDKQHVVNVKFVQKKINVFYYKEIKKGKYEPVPFSVLNTEVKRKIIDLLKVKFDISRTVSFNSSTQKVAAKKYIFKKLARIALTYNHYNMYFNQHTLFNVDLLTEYIEKIKTDTSHITYKLRQAINFIKYENLLPEECRNKKEFTLNIEDQSDLYQKFKATESNLPIIEILPPPIYEPTIYVADKNAKESPFNLLSSGEKQQIHAVHSILYHLKNLDSVKSGTGNLLQYDNINLLLDEIELYYHPEMQRKYLNYLLKMIGKLELPNTSYINICMVTHSPYILSDIPDVFTLKIDDGKPVDRELKSFGANIYDLLADGFFMSEGFVGDVALQKIKEIINYCKEEVNFDEKKQRYYANILETIGDRVIYLKLKELLQNKLNTQELTKEARLARLVHERDQIDAKIKKLEENDRN